MSTDRHVALYAEQMAFLAASQHDDGNLDDDIIDDRESEIMRAISQAPPETPAGAAAVLRFWLAIIRSDEGSKWMDELDLLAMSNVADFLEALPAGMKPDPALIPARLRDLEVRVKRAEAYIDGQLAKARKAG